MSRHPKSQGRKPSKRGDKRLSPEKLRKFRHQISTLKKAGLISNKVDARAIKPTEHYKKIIEEFRGVVEGRQRAIPLSKKYLDIAKEDGKTVRNGHIVIENNPGMRVVKDSRDPYGYRISHPSTGLQMIEHRGPRGRSLKQYIAYANSHMEPGGLIGFTVEGFRSNMLYQTVEEAVAAFERYNTMVYGGRSAAANLASSFTIYRVPKRIKWHWKKGRSVGKGSKPRKRRK